MCVASAFQNYATAPRARLQFLYSRKDPKLLNYDATRMEKNKRSLYILVRDTPGGDGIKYSVSIFLVGFLFLLLKKVGI